jgi:hypothetical protein
MSTSGCDRICSREPARWERFSRHMRGIFDPPLAGLFEIEIGASNSRCAYVLGAMHLGICLFCVCVALGVFVGFDALAFSSILDWTFHSPNI